MVSKLGPGKEFHVSIWEGEKISTSGSSQCDQTKAGTRGARPVSGPVGPTQRKDVLGQSKRAGQGGGIIRDCRGPWAEILFMFHILHVLRSFLPFQKQKFKNCSNNWRLFKEGTVGFIRTSVGNLEGQVCHDKPFIGAHTMWYENLLADNNRSWHLAFSTVQATGAAGRPHASLFTTRDTRGGSDINHAYSSWFTWRERQQ